MSDTSVFPRSRRAFLAAALGALGVSAAQALTRPATALAGTDGDVVLGEANESATTTVIANTSTGTALIATTGGDEFPPPIETSTAVYGISLDGTGVYGASGSGPGVYAASHGEGVAAMIGQGNAGTGVHGITGPVSGRPVSPIGAGIGVYGSAVGAGTGVHGAAASGTAVHAATADPMVGYALRAVGRVRLDKSAGIATILAGNRSVTVTPGIDVASTSAVVATLMGPAGGRTTVHRVALDTANNRFSIYLTTESTVNVKVAWHIFG